MRRERELRRRRRRHGSSQKSQTLSKPRPAARGREEKDIAAARSRPLAQPRGTEVEGDTADLPLRPPVVLEGGESQDDLKGNSVA